MTTEDIDILEQLTVRLAALNNAISHYDVPRTNFAMILEDERLLAKYHKEWNRLARRAAFVSTFRKEFLQLGEANPEEAIRKIKTQRESLFEAMRIFDIRLVGKLQHALNETTKFEIKELEKCMRDVGEWRSYRNKYGIEFFTGRLSVYLEGGHAQGLDFEGLASHYKDVRLARELYENDAVRRLFTYKKQLDFLSWLRFEIRKAVESREWEGFLGKKGILQNLTKGKKYIKTVSEKFANREFAELLESLKDNEAPALWEAPLRNFYNEKIGNAIYQNHTVLAPASQALLNLFQKRIDEINLSKFEFNEISKILEELENDVRGSIKQARRRVKRVRKKFEYSQYGALEELGEATSLLIRYMESINDLPEQRVKQLKHTVGAEEGWLRRYNANARNMFGNKAPIGVALFDAAGVDRIEQYKTRLIFGKLVDENLVNNVAALEERVNGILMPELQKIQNFIAGYDNEFIIPISSTADFIPEIKQISKQH